MATEKTTTLTFRIEPNIKDALCIAADRDHRSIANMVAVMIREHCARVEIAIQDRRALLGPFEGKKTTWTRKWNKATTWQQKPETISS